MNDINMNDINELKQKMILLDNLLQTSNNLANYFSKRMENAAVLNYPNAADVSHLNYLYGNAIEKSNKIISEMQKINGEIIKLQRTVK